MKNSLPIIRSVSVLRKEFLRKNELDSLSLLLEEKEQQIAYLKSENDKLAMLIHKDNKILPALCMAVLDEDRDKETMDLLEKDETREQKRHRIWGGSFG